jgi:two-component system phosphate regulon response regulator PhoB
MLRAALEREGYETICAQNGAEGVRRLAESPPCVIILEFEMPIMDGQDFRAIQKRLAPTVPIICITAPDGADARARLVGAAALHVKPFETDAMSASVRALCAIAHSHAVGRQVTAPWRRTVR